MRTLESNKKYLILERLYLNLASIMQLQQQILKFLSICDIRVQIILFTKIIQFECQN